MTEDQISYEIIGAAIEVHKHLGPGLLESAYEECLAKELCLRDIPFQRQKPLPISYKGTDVDVAYRLDMFVADKVLVELKAVDSILPIHEAQVLTYLWLSGCRLGLLINFNVPVVRDGIRRLVLDL